MGAGASAQGDAAALAGSVTAASEQDLREYASRLPDDSKARLLAALGDAASKACCAERVDAVKADGAEGGAASKADGAQGGLDDPDAIPAEWGWPKEPHDAAFLRQFVLVYTKASQQEEWDEALQARSVGGTFEDHLAEKAFVNLLLNKEGTGEEKDGQANRGVDPNAYKRGKWYRFLNAKGDCNVYVHNYTCDVTAARPDNFSEMTPEELDRLRKLGTYIKDLPGHLAKVYDKQKQIPIVFGSPECCEALKTFSEYAKDWQLLDVTKLKRVNEKALEESRQAIVTAMKLGKWLLVYLGDTIPDLGEKICTTKNRDKFPVGLWQHGGLDVGMVKDKIYREEDKEGGQFVCREGFRVCVVLMYDTHLYVHSSFRKDDMRTKIPNFNYMEQVNCYADGDIKNILAAEI